MKKIFFILIVLLIIISFLPLFGDTTKSPKFKGSSDPLIYNDSPIYPKINFWEYIVIDK
jgi:hypothetical protein